MGGVAKQPGHRLAVQVVHAEGVRIGRRGTGRVFTKDHTAVAHRPTVGAYRDRLLPAGARLSRLRGTFGGYSQTCKPALEAGQVGLVVLTQVVQTFGGRTAVRVAAGDHDGLRRYAGLTLDVCTNFRHFAVMKANEVGGDDGQFPVAVRQVERAGPQVIVDAGGRAFPAPKTAQVYANRRGDVVSADAGDEMGCHGFSSGFSLSRFRWLRG